jgi:hypothetical protein
MANMSHRLDKIKILTYPVALRYNCPILVQFIEYFWQ